MTRAQRPIDCPKCRARMQRASVDGVEIDRCPDCGTLFLDLGELERLAQGRSIASADTHATGEGDRTDQTRTARCPRDGQGMILVSTPRGSHVRYEQCPHCGGIVLDAGELRELGDRSALQRVRAWFGGEG